MSIVTVGELWQLFYV